MVILYNLGGPLSLMAMFVYTSTPNLFCSPPPPPPPISAWPHHPPGAYGLCPVHLHQGVSHCSPGCICIPISNGTQNRFCESENGTWRGWRRVSFTIDRHSQLLPSLPPSKNLHSQSSRSQFLLIHCMYLLALLVHGGPVELEGGMQNLQTPAPISA